MRGFVFGDALDGAREVGEPAREREFGRMHERFESVAVLRGASSIHTMPEGSVFLETNALEGPLVEVRKA